MKYVLFLETDVSLDTGDGINEREALDALWRQFPDRIEVVLPSPLKPGTYFDERVHYIHHHQKYHPWHYGRFLMEGWQTLRQILRKEPIAGVVTRLGPSLLIPQLLLKTKTPLLFKTLAAYNHMQKPDDRWYKRLASWAHTKGAPGVFRQCVGADVVSAHYRNWFSQEFNSEPEKFVPLFNGANGEQLKPGDRQLARKLLGVDHFQQIIGYVGAIQKMRHLDLAIRALAQLRDLAGLGMVFVGDGPAIPDLQRLAREWNVANRVVFHPPLAYREMGWVINAFDVALDLTQVAIPFAHSVEIASFSQKISQYLACGVPTIAWDTVDTRFLAEEGLGRLVPPGSPEQLAVRLREQLFEQAAQPDSTGIIRAYFEKHLSADEVARRRLAIWDNLRLLREGRFPENRQRLQAETTGGRLVA